MGSFVYYCNQKEIIINQDIYLSFEEDLNSNQDKKGVDTAINLIKKKYLKSYFEILKEYNKTNDNNKKINQNKDDGIININNNLENGDDDYNILDKNNIEINNNKEIINKQQQ